MPINYYLVTIVAQCKHIIYYISIYQYLIDAFHIIKDISFAHVTNEGILQSYNNLYDKIAKLISTTSH